MTALPGNVESERKIDLYDDMEDDWDNFSRDPGYARFSYKDQDLEFIIITCHLDPEQHAAYETERLDDVYRTVKEDTKNPNIFVLGDFNLAKGPADIAFRKAGLLDEGEYPKMKAVLDENDDTTIGAGSKTYDNILFDSDQFKLIDQNVCRFDDKFGKGYNKKISDHFPVWAIFEFRTTDDTEAE